MVKGQTDRHTMQMGLLQASGVLEATRTRPCGMSPCDYDRRGRETDKYTIQSKVKHLLGGLWRGRKKGRRGREREKERKGERERGSLAERGDRKREGWYLRLQAGREWAWLVS